MTKLTRPETTGADISTSDKSEALISILDEYIEQLEKELLLEKQHSNLIRGYNDLGICAKCKTKFQK